jgi:disulfide bond formation protein DsbB
MKLQLTPRLGYLAGFLMSGGLIAYAYYLQYYEYQNPCPLCIMQRVVYFALSVVFLTGALHGPRRTGAGVYSALLTLISLVGAGIATRHVWLQHLPKDKVPECGPGLSYILDRFPLMDAFAKIFRGSGECAEASWKLVGLSIAEWSLVWFILLGAFAVMIALAARKQQARGRV